MRSTTDIITISDTAAAVGTAALWMCHEVAWRETKAVGYFVDYWWNVARIVRLALFAVLFGGSVASLFVAIKYGERLELFLGVLAGVGVSLALTDSGFSASDVGTKCVAKVLRSDKLRFWPIEPNDGETNKCIITGRFRFTRHRYRGGGTWQPVKHKRDEDGNRFLPDWGLEHRIGGAERKEIGEAIFGGLRVDGALIGHVLLRWLPTPALSKGLQLKEVWAKDKTLAAGLRGVRGRGIVGDEKTKQYSDWVVDDDNLERFFKLWGREYYEHIPALVQRLGHVLKTSSDGAGTMLNMEKEMLELSYHENEEQYAVQVGPISGRDHYREYKEDHPL